jgi:hypothetical protein
VSHVLDLNPDDRFTCPACLERTLHLQAVRYGREEASAAVWIDYSADCECGFAATRDTRERMPLSAVVLDVVLTDLARKARTGISKK